MNSSKRVFLGLDIGSKRIGVALGDSVGKVAWPVSTIKVADASALRQVVREQSVTDLVVGKPRSQAGESTAQTVSTEQFAKRVLQPLGVPIHWQDESVTSVVAEERLRQRKKPYSKADIDKEAACIILQDYLEQL